MADFRRADEPGDRFTLEDTHYPEPPKKQGGGCLRSCLIFGGIAFLVFVLIVGIGGYFAYQAFKEAITQDPITLNAWVQDALPSTIPPGYECKFGLNFAGVKFVAIEPVGVDLRDEDDAKHPDESHTVFMIFTAGMLNMEQLTEQLEKQLEKEGRGPRGGADVKESIVEVLVAGKKLPANRREWTEDGHRVVQFYVVPRQGVLLAAMGPLEEFDQKAFDSLLASIKPDEGVKIDAPPPAKPKDERAPTKPATIPKQ